MPIPEKLTPEEIRNRFSYHAPSPEGVARHSDLTRAFVEVATLINDVCPGGREKSSAFTKLEEAKFHASAAVARNPDTR